MSTLVSTSVAHTASDALNAKASALSVGYKPVQPQDGLYAKLLGRINSALQEESADGQRNGTTNNDQQKHKKKAFKRQTPLVNAGYAARMAAASHTVGRFVLAHHGDLIQRRAEVRKPINIVLVGCGMEALGIWASALSSCPSIVCIYEIDCEKICSAKSTALIKSGLVAAASKKRESDDISLYLTGATNFQALVSKRKKEISDDLIVGGSHYSLISADLRNVYSVRRALHEAKFDNTYPTIVISELVLAYLGRLYADELLRYISSEVCCCEGSLFFAYEPIGAEPSQPECPTVIGDYIQDYSNKFREKLNRGKHDKDDVGPSDEDCYNVLGDGCNDTLSRFSTCGFEGPMGCCVAGVAASTACGGNMACSEIFDEHLELAVHLHCYGTVSAFSYETRHSFACSVCPWLKVPATSSCHCRESDVWKNVELQDRFIVKISPIKSEDQESVRDLFKTTYQALYDDYPSVRKLVQNALKTDLSGKHSDMSTYTIKGISAINERYSGDGGGFWVATVANGSARKVVGCIGIRPYTSKENVDEKAYEIQRLVVDDEYRARGIGKALLQFMENFVSRSNTDVGECKVYAITPAVLKNANHFYKARGYDLVEENLIGKMMMNTYVKSIEHKSR